MANFKIDLPIDDIQPYINDMLEQLGLQCTIDDVPTKLMLSDLDNEYTIIDENTKQGVCSKAVNVSRGSAIHFSDDRKAIVYTTPNDDIVSQSMKILIYNASINIYDFEDIYDEDTGDIIDSISVVKDTLDGYIERISAVERETDIGTIYQSKLKFITSEDCEINLGDIVEFSGDDYSITDIDDITEGLLIIILESE